jgi:ABC-2 type transport system permease protein
VSILVSVPRAAFLLARLRLRRQLNRFGSPLGHAMARRTGPKAAGRSSPLRWLLSALVAVLMLVSFTNLAYRSMVNMQKELGTVLVRATSAPDRGAASQDQRAQFLMRRAAAAPGSVLAPGVLQGARLAVSVLLLAALLIALASREIARPEWDLEWLATLPMPLSTLLASRLIERVVTNSSGFLTLAPFLSVLAWFCGYRWSAPLAGIALTLALLVAVATVQILVDTGLRLSLPPHQLRNFHALISIVSLPVLFAVLSMALADNTFMFDVARVLPDWTRWLPSGLAVAALASSDPAMGVFWSALMVAEIAAIVVIGLAVLARQLRYGIVSVGTREAGVRSRVKPRAPQTASREHAFALASPVQRRELRLLARDRTFMVQTLVLPLTIVGMQILLNANSNIFAGAVDTPSALAAIAFGLAAYTLMFSAFHTLNAEGQALWILYCVPHSLEAVLRQKAGLWSAVAIVYPLAMFVIAAVVAGGVSPAFLGSVAIVLVGVPIFATIATALGVFGCDPLAQDVRRRVRPTYLYLYMVVASLYAYAIFADRIWQRASLMILTGLLAVALWQKARDQLPYLLDPSASPPARVSVSDGLIAALLFFVLQALIAAGEMAFSRSHMLTPNMMWIAFCGAGAVTYAATRLIYWRARTVGVPRIWNDGGGAALIWGIAGGVAAALVGLAYIEIAAALDAFPTFHPTGVFAGMGATLWLAVIAIIAAPIFEEFIFRGLIFGGLRRSFGFLPAALASAAIFAVVHPPVSAIPVFVMGLCAALAYERTGVLAAPMGVHAIYNAAVLGFQWNIMQM